MGHMASNCAMNYRCVKCKQDPYHLPGECPLIKNKSLQNHKLYCVQCKEYGHPASYRGCPKIKNYIQNTQKPTLYKENISSPNIVNGRSFSAVLSPPKQNNSSTSDDFESLKNSLLACIENKFNMVHATLRTQISRIDYLYSSRSQIQ